MWFECLCGHRIHDISDAQSFKAHLIPDHNWNPFWEDIDQAIESSGPSSKEKEQACMQLRSHNYCSHRLYQCVACGRLHLSGKGDTLISFKPEKENTSKNLFDTHSNQKNK